MPRETLWGMKKGGDAQRRNESALLDGGAHGGVKTGGEYLYKIPRAPGIYTSIYATFDFREAIRLVRSSHIVSLPNKLLFPLRPTLAFRNKIIENIIPRN